MQLTVIHPAVYVIYYILLIIFAFIYNDPYYLLLFLSIITILITLQGIKHELWYVLKYFIPMSVIIIVLNPLVSHMGTTKIYILGSYFITIEALVYGMLMSMSLLIILLLFTSYNRTVSYQEMLYLFSKKFPNISMVIIMALRFIPLLSIRLNDVNKIYNFNKKNEDDNSRINKIKTTAHSLAVVVSWSLEESIVTANSMKARGYGIKKRTNYLYYKFRKIDYLLIILISFLSIACIIGLVQGFGRIAIYPTLTFSLPENILNIYYFLFLMLLLPFIYLELKESRIWH